MLDIRLLGSPVVTVDGRAIEVDTRKAIAMLAYLAVEHTAEREALAGLFWGDSPPDRARATLRRTLSALRSGIGRETISSDRDQVTLIGPHRCDVDDFEAAIDATARHGHDPRDVCEMCIDPLTEAAALYRGDFLGAFAVRDAPDFEDWVRPTAESLRLRAGDVYQRLAMAHASSGDYTAATEVASRWIRLDELHEPAYRLLMLLRAWAGDRAGAIQAYRESVAMLDTELGVSPLEETTELFEAILDEDLPPAPALRRTPRPSSAPRTAATAEMIDRATEMQALSGLLQQTGGDGRLGLITGESWMGKTRLIEYLAERAGVSGFAVITGRGYRAETELPYGVATQWLKQLTELLDESGDELETWALQELSRLEPKLSTRGTHEEAERLGQLRLQEAFLELVQTTASKVPLLMYVDDAQWADTASASLIGYIQRRIARAEAVVLISSRREVDLPRALRDLAGNASLSLDLRPLRADDLENDHPDMDLTGIIDATGGVPLLVKEALESGSVAPDSVNVARYLESRRRRLSDLSRQVLAAAAVLDGMFDGQLLKETSGRTDEEVVDAVEELVTAGLIREEREGVLRFTLDALETVTYESMSLIRRRLLHRRAAEALQARPRSRTDARLATAIARHLRAGGGEDAGEWYKLAGDLSRAVFANDEAVSAYETAIALGHPDVGAVRLALGELAMVRGDYQTATKELRTAASHLTGPELAVVEHRIGDLNRILGRFELAEESFKRSRDAHPSPGELYADWALLDHRIGKTASAIELARMAVDEARSSADQELLARALNILGLVTPSTEDAMAHIESALDIGGSSEPARMAALNSKAHLLGESGDTETAISLVTEAIEIARRAGYRHRQAALHNHLADLLHQAGREEEAREALTEAVTLFADIAAGDWEPEVWLMREW